MALTLHSDRGSPMTAGSMTQLLASLQVEQSLSRPCVSNHNPFVESHFETAKYRPNPAPRTAQRRGGTPRAPRCGTEAGVPAGDAVVRWSEMTGSEDDARRLRAERRRAAGMSGEIVAAGVPKPALHEATTVADRLVAAWQLSRRLWLLSGRTLEDPPRAALPGATFDIRAERKRTSDRLP